MSQLESYEFGSHVFGYNVAVASRKRSIFMSIVPKHLGPGHDRDIAIANNVKRVDGIGRSFPREVINDILDNSTREDASNYVHSFLAPSLDAIDIFYFIGENGNPRVESAIVSGIKYPELNVDGPFTLIYVKGLLIAGVVGEGEASKVIVNQSELTGLRTSFTDLFVPGLETFSMSFLQEDGRRYTPISINPSTAFRPLEDRI